MGDSRTVDSTTPQASGWSRAPVARCTRRSQRYPMGLAYRRAVARYSRPISIAGYLPPAFPGMESDQSIREDPARIGRRPSRPRQTGPDRMLRRRLLRGGEKRGLCVGPTKRGKGTKLMAVADGHGLPVAIDVASASPAEVKLVPATIDARFVEEVPERLIGDKAYDSDPLAETLAEIGIELIAPHRRNRKVKTQDGRPLRRYKRRWKIERLFAWLHNYRRLVTRWEYDVRNFLGFVQLGCIIILLRRCL